MLVELLLVCPRIMIMDELFYKKPLHIKVQELFLCLCYSICQNPLHIFLSIHECFNVELVNYTKT